MSDYLQRLVNRSLPTTPTTPTASIQPTIRTWSALANATHPDPFSDEISSLGEEASPTRTESPSLPILFDNQIEPPSFDTPSPIKPSRVPSSPALDAIAPPPLSPELSAPPSPDNPVDLPPPEQAIVATPTPPIMGIKPLSSDSPPLPPETEPPPSPPEMDIDDVVAIALARMDQMLMPKHPPAIASPPANQSISPFSPLTPSLPDSPAFGIEPPLLQPVAPPPLQPPAPPPPRLVIGRVQVEVIPTPNQRPVSPSPQRTSSRKRVSKQSLGDRSLSSNLRFGLGQL